MQNNAPDPARCTRAWPLPYVANSQQGAKVVTDGVSIRGNGTADDPLTVNHDDMLKYAESTWTLKTEPCFVMSIPKEIGLVIPPRYRQILHNGKQSIFTVHKGGYYLLALTAVFEEVLDASRVILTIWRNDNRSDSGASGELIGKTCSATEPMVLSVIAPLTQGDDIWATVWHDAQQPLIPKMISFSILDAFSPQFSPVVTK